MSHPTCAKSLGNYIFFYWLDKFKEKMRLENEQHAYCLSDHCDSFHYNFDIKNTSLIKMKNAISHNDY